MTALNRIARLAAPDTFRAEVDRLFDGFLSAWEGQTTREFAGGLFPALNLHEDDRAFHVEAELPGLALEDISVTVQGQ